MEDLIKKRYNEFDKQKISRKIYNDFLRTILLKITKLEKINHTLEGKLDENVLGYSIMAPVDLMIDEEEAAAEDLMHQSSMVRCVDIVEAVSGIDDMQD